MGQIFSYFYGNKPSLTLTETFPGRPSYSSVSKRSSTVSQSFISVPPPVWQFPHRGLPSRSSSKVEGFVRELNHRYNCSGESFVDATYPEDERIKKLITVHLPYVEITRVCVVKNTYLHGMYDLKKAEYESWYGKSAVQELNMFHSTSEINAKSIVKDNLDWRRVRRSLFGTGVSFSKDPDYCNFYCNDKNGYWRVFIVASVLVCRRKRGYKTMPVPPKNFDTAVGNDELVYVKFSDNEFIPKYLVFYNAPSKQRSKYWK